MGKSVLLSNNGDQRGAGPRKAGVFGYNNSRFGYTCFFYVAHLYNIKKTEK